MAATGNFTSFDDFLEMYENLTPEQTRRLEEARARKLGSRTSSYGNRTQYSNEIEDILETEISHSEKKLAIDRKIAEINEHILKLKEDLANATTEEEKAEIRAKIRGDERLIREAEEARYAESRLGRLTKTTGKINDIYRGIQEIVTAVQKLNNPWADADAAASKYAKTVGLVQKGMEALRKQTIENVAKGRIGINYNTSTQELLELQSNYAKAAGRNIRLSNEDQENLAAVNFATQGLGTELLPEFEKMGVFLSDASSHIGKMYAQASKEGISLERYAKNVQQGLAMAQTYNFKNGLKGMEEMAKRAAAIRMDMSQVQSFANSFDTIEKSITNAAKLQVLGGPFAAAADPLGMLHDSLMGVEDTQKRMEQIIANIGVYDRKTGEAYTSAFDKQRLKAYAEATGQDFNKVMENVNRNIVVKEIRSQINSSAHASGLNEDIKKLIENSGEIREGKAGVSINGEFKTIDELENEDKDLLVRETKSQSEDIKDIARDVRSLKDMREGFGKQREAVQARFSERTRAGQAEKGATGWLGGQNWFHGILNSLTTLVSFTTAIGMLRGRGGGRLFRAIRRGPTAPVTTAPSTIVEGATEIASGANTAAKTGRIGRAASRIKSAAKLSETVRKTKQIANLVKAGKGVKVASAGLKAAGKKIPIAGALLSAGIEAFENKEKFADRQTRGKAIGQTAGAGIGAALGAGLGTLIGPLGTIVGGVVGEKLGKFVGGAIGGTVTKIQNVRRDNARAKAERKIKDKDAARAIGKLTGDYSVKQMREIQAAVKDGGFNKKKLSNKALRKLRESGDIEMLEALQDKQDAVRIEAKEKKKKEREERRAEAKKNRFNTATFEIGTAYISPISIKGGKPEDGKSGHLSVMEKMRWRAEKEGNENGHSNNGPIEVKIDGKIELKTPNGQSFDIMAEIKKDPALLRKLTQEIIKEMNVQKYGGYKSSRTLGNNIPTANA